MAKRNLQFQTIRTEGAILPPDILRRIASLKVDGATPDGYHLPPGTKLNEAISQSWIALLHHWQAFQEQRAKLGENGDTGTAITNERWLLPLFTELGYGRLVTTKSPVIGDRSYAIERFYNHTPIHLIGCKLPLDRRTRGARGAATASPHSMVQEFLNCSDECVWAFLSNGLQLRILRDNVSLSRQTFVEFDLEAMMEGEVYADFALLWLLCHQSRVESDKPEECWLEKWSKLAREQGTRVLNDLRIGVAKSIEALGRGFIGHPRNDHLREKLQTGTLTKDDFYRQLLRIVYRLLFLFVAEDRELLHSPDAAKDACDLYDSHYSTRRLRDLALKMRGTKHADLWYSLSLVFDALGKNEGRAQLGLSGLGSFLWRSSSTADVLGPYQANGEAVLITNDDLLQAIRALAYVEQDRVLRTVDYRNLGSEELGSVYESLLELHPVIDVEGKAFDLMTAAGNERKLTGSYYTPDSLVQCLLDSALDPVVEDRLKGKKGAEAEKAILDIKVCDPASGSGHFLIAAAHRLARHLARARTGESEPSPEDYQHALRDVIGRCVYGVDINPMAVELCKVSLWMEAIEPGKPLSFLDHHIQCGNSLLGTTPALLAMGIPDEAFKAIEGDVKGICSELKRDNKRERQEYQSGQGYLFAPPIKLGNLPAMFARLDQGDDDSILDIEEKQRLYEQAVKGADYLNARLLADTWCAVFMWKKDSSGLGKQCPTERVFRSIENSPHSILPEVKDEVRRVARQYQFFHWHLAYPDVFRLPAESNSVNPDTGWNGGFDLILGNPPWDTLSPDQREFFSSWIVGLRSMSPTDQQSRIAELLEDQTISSSWAAHCRRLFALVHFFKDSGVFTLFAPGNLGKGDFNIYRMFVEIALRRVRNGGWVGQVVPGGLYGGANATAIRRHLLEHCELERLYGLINTTRGWFAKVDIDRFAAFAARVGGHTVRIVAQFGLAGPDDLSKPSVTLNAQTVRELSPTTLAIPDVRDLGQLLTSKKMYATCAPFGVEIAGTPKRHFCREIDMGTDRGLFCMDPNGLPVYEGRMIDAFDHRAKTYESGHGNSAVWIERPFGDPAKAIVPQWRVLRERTPRKLGNRCDTYRIGFGDVANPRNERSFVATLIPPGVVCGDKVPTLDFGSGNEWYFLPWLVVANSFVMDWLARAKLTSPKMAFSLLDSLPFPRWSIDDLFVRDVAPIALRLVCTAPEMVPYWNAMSAHGLAPPLSGNDVFAEALSDQGVRDVARAHLDAYVATRVFGLSSDELSAIMDTFPVLKRRDERQYGEFRTKRMVLEAFDSLLGSVARVEDRIVDAAVAPEAHVDEDLSLGELSYPSTARDRLVCAMALSTVELRGSLPSADHLDAILLLVYPDWCKAFLEQPQHGRFDGAMAGIANVLSGDGSQSIGWKQCRDYLEQRRAVSVDHSTTAQPITAASELVAVKRTLPGDVADAVGFALVALNRMNALRQRLADANPAQRQVLESLEQQHRDLQLVA